MSIITLIRKFGRKIERKIDKYCATFENPKMAKRCVWAIFIGIITVLLGIANGFVNKIFCVVIVLEASIIYNLIIKSMTTKR